MTLRHYVILMVAATLLCWGAWWLVLVYLDPMATGWFGFGFFYSALYLALVGSFALLGLGLRLVILRHEVVFRQVSIAFRQAFSFAFLVIAGLFLQSRDLLFWWNMLLLVLAVTLLEFAVLTLRRRSPLL